MTVTFRSATSKNDPKYLMIGVAGYSGTGKTMSALRLARGLAGDKPFAFIDTEAGRGLHYQGTCAPWDHADLEPPFTPEAYLSAIRDAESAGYGVIVVDSASHEYSGSGGLSDMAAAELHRLAGDDPRKQAKLTMASWSKPKQRHAAFVESLLRVKAHVVLCFRAREAVEMRPDPKTGRMEVLPVESIAGHSGWLIDTEHKRMPLPYELTASFLLIPRAGADRGVPIPVKLNAEHTPFVPLNEPLSERTGAALAKWAAGESAATTPDPSIAGLTKGLLDLAATLGQSEAAFNAVEKHRAKNADPAHVAWLHGQITRFEDAVKVREGASA